jgi:hypothetical protein
LKRGLAAARAASIIGATRTAIFTNVRLIISKVAPAGANTSVPRAAAR